VALKRSAPLEAGRWGGEARGVWRGLERVPAFRWPGRPAPEPACYSRVDPHVCILRPCAGRSKRLHAWW